MTKTPKEAIASADVEFLHGVPVHPNERGAEAIITAIDQAGYAIIPKTTAAGHVITELRIAGQRMEIQAGVMKDWSIRFYALAASIEEGQAKQ
jgi:hypothetical protein